LSKWILLALLGFSSGFAYADTVLPGGNSGKDIEHWFQTVSSMSATDLAAQEGQRFSFSVDLDNSPSFSMDYDVTAGSLTLLYRMAFNNVAEGWSWDTQANPETSDYYRFKFLPLKSTLEEKSPPVEMELYPGKRLEVRNQWRYDYFLAFENLYDFYPRKVDDDAGFGATVKVDRASVPEKNRLRMLAVFRLKAPFHAESNTFWKADFAEPVDFTLRKRYLIGELEEIRFLDRVTGFTFARLLRPADGAKSK